MRMSTSSMIADVARLVERANLVSHRQSVTYTTQPQCFRSHLTDLIHLGHAAVVRTLLNAHASINIKDKRGQTPLHGASMYGG